MTSPSVRHPSHTDLLLAADGTLEPRRLIEVRDHLRHCASCEGLLRDLDTVVDACASSSSNDAATAPTASQFDRRLRVEATADRAGGRRSASLMQLRLVAVLGLVCLAISGEHLAPTVRADQLLASALRVEHARSGPAAAFVQVIARRSRGTRSATLVTPPGARIGRASRHEASATTTSEEAAVQRALRDAGLDVEAPLSVAAFQQWRATLPRKRDRVIEDARMVTIETTSQYGARRVGRVVLSRPTLRVVSMTWSLAEGLEIEIREAATMPAEPTVAARPPHGAAASAATFPRKAAARRAAVDPATLAAREIDAFTILHEAGADVGQDVRVTRRAAGVAIDGVIGDRGRRDALVARLRLLDAVAVRLETPDELRASPRRRGPSRVIAMGSSSPPVLQRWLKESFAQPREQAAYAGRALDLGQALRARALMVQTLDQRYRPNTRDGLPADTRRALETLVASHVRQMRDTRADLVTHLAPLASLHTSARPGTVTISAQALVAAAIEADARLVDLFSARICDSGGCPDPVESVEAVMARLANALALLESALAVDSSER